MPDFLRNDNALPLGTRQDGRCVHDVELPPWAQGSADDFIRIHRAALESDFVSRRLHHWVDLIFGYQQQGEEARSLLDPRPRHAYTQPQRVSLPFRSPLRPLSRVLPPAPPPHGRRTRSPDAAAPVLRHAATQARKACNVFYYITCVQRARMAGAWGGSAAAAFAIELSPQLRSLAVWQV